MKRRRLKGSMIAISYRSLTVLVPYVRFAVFQTRTSTGARMKRIALAVALVVMAAGACKKAQNNAADSTRADTTHMMADSMKMAAPDTAKMRGVGACEIGRAHV